MFYVLVAIDLGISFQNLNIYKNLQKKSLSIIMATNKTIKRNVQLLQINKSPNQKK
jgi:hypothetical protein